MILDNPNKRVLFGFKIVKDSYLSKPVEENVIAKNHYESVLEDIQSIDSFRQMMRKTTGLDFFSKNTEIYFGKKFGQNTELKF